MCIREKKFQESSNVLDSSRKFEKSPENSRISLNLSESSYMIQKVLTWLRKFLYDSESSRRFFNLNYPLEVRIRLEKEQFILKSVSYRQKGLNNGIISIAHVISSIDTYKNRKSEKTYKHTI